MQEMAGVDEPMNQARVGIYEKALPQDLSWERRLSEARRAGYDYVELSIDESEERLARLDWSVSNRAAVRQAIENAGVPLLTMCLSAVRKFSLGSASLQTRSTSLKVFRKAMDLAADVGVRLIQISGYDVFYEQRDNGTRERFMEGLHQVSQWAGRNSIMLGLENVDAPVIDSMKKAVAVVKEIDSPWVHLYPDIGNLAAAGNSPATDLALTAGHLLAVHVKDALPGQIRHVPFKQGIVPFEDTFRALRMMRFCGPMTVEMWTDRMAGTDPIEVAQNVCQFVRRLWQAAGPPSES